MIFLFEDFDGSLIENLIEGEKLFDEFDFLLFAHLLYFWALQSWFQVVGGFESFGVGEHGLPDHLTPFEFFLHCGVIVFQTVLSQFSLYFDLLHSFPEKAELCAIEIFICVVGDIERLFVKEQCQFVGSFFCFCVLFFEGGLEGRYFFSDFEQFSLAGGEVVFCELFEDVVADELDEVVYLLAPGCVFVAEGVEDD